MSFESKLLMVMALFVCGYLAAEPERDPMEGMRLEAQGRDCAAIAVMRGSESQSQNEQRAIALAISNGIARGDFVDGCQALPVLLGENIHMAAPHELVRFMSALSVVDSVMTAPTYTPSDFCGGANHFSHARNPMPFGARPLCKVGQLVFYKAERDQSSIALGRHSTAITHPTN